MKRDVAKFVKFGRGGDTVYYGGGCVGSGYGTPESPHAAKPAEIPDGTPVIDIRDAVETKAGYSWVFCGPMLNPDMPDGAIDYCPEPSGIMANAMAETSYGGLLTIQKVQRSAEPKAAGALDHVGIADYIAGWRQRGARVGQYVGGQIVWDN